MGKIYGLHTLELRPGIAGEVERLVSTQGARYGTIVTNPAATVR